MKKQHYLAIFLLVFMLAVVYKVTSSSLPGSAQALELLEEAIDNEVPAWLLFHSNTCEPCIEMKAVFDGLASEYDGEIAFIPVQSPLPSVQSSPSWPWACLWPSSVASLV